MSELIPDPPSGKSSLGEEYDRIMASVKEASKGPPPLDTYQSTDAIVATVGTLNGNREALAYVISACWLLSVENEGVLPPAMAVWNHYSQQLNELGITENDLRRLYSDEEFKRGVYLRGIRSLDNGLDARMLLGLSVLTEFSSRLTLTAKLKSIGVSSTEYAAWLNYKPFHERLVALSNKALKGSVSNSKIALSQAAAGGDLNAIKFLFEITGEHDPAQQARFDGERLVRGMAEIIMQYITEPEVLRAIAGKISVLLAANGVNQN